MSTLDKALDQPRPFELVSESDLRAMISQGQELQKRTSSYSEIGKRIHSRLVPMFNEMAHRQERGEL